VLKVSSNIPTGGIGCVDGERGAASASTEGVPETTADLHAAIQAKLPPAKWKILDVLIAEYPKAMTKDARRRADRGLADLGRIFQQPRDRSAVSG
jgi:hypothetical protein